jgi:hypothetical protein
MAEQINQPGIWAISIGLKYERKEKQNSCWSNLENLWYFGVK